MIRGELAQPRRAARLRAGPVRHGHGRARPPADQRARRRHGRGARRRHDRGLRRRRLRDLVGPPALAARDRDRRAGAAAPRARRRRGGAGVRRVDGTVIVERNPCLSGGALEIFLEPQLPSARVLIVGDAPIARALKDLRRASGYDVVVADADEAEPGSGDAAVVVASHGSGEERVLGEALSAGVPYVALVASRVRGAAVRAALDVPDELRQQLHTPAGWTSARGHPLRSRSRSWPSWWPSIMRRPRPRGRRSSSGLHRRPIPSAAWRWRSRMRLRISTPPAGACTSAAPVAGKRTSSSWPVMSALASGLRRNVSAGSTGEFVTGLVLAAGGSTRLGQPKQLLPYGSATLLDHVLDTARAATSTSCCASSAAASRRCGRRSTCDGVEVVENAAVRRGLLVVDRRGARRRRPALRRCSC